jgi:hypothetical protein
MRVAHAMSANPERAQRALSPTSQGFCLTSVQEQKRVCEGRARKRSPAYPEEVPSSRYPRAMCAREVVKRTKVAPLTTSNDALD